MMMFYVLGLIVIITLGVVGFLFFLLQKEGVKESELKVVPIANPGEFLKSEAKLHLPSAQEEAYKKKAEELEEELRVISDKGIAQAKEAMTMIETLTKENESLKAQCQNQGQDTEELTKTREQIGQLGQDNAALQSQLDTSRVKLQELQEEVTAIRRQMRDEVAASTSLTEQGQKPVDRSIG